MQKKETKAVFILLRSCFIYLKDAIAETPESSLVHQPLPFTLKDIYAHTLLEVCTHCERMGEVVTAKEAECETFVCVSNSTGLSVSLGLSLLA